MKVLTQKELLPFKGIWHSIKKEHIDNILNNNFLEARTTQRYWKDGMVYRDNNRDVYENSFLMKGWSMTRDKSYAFSWACVTLLLDWEAIRRDFKTKTISWNYRSSACQGNYDKEREEFIVSDFITKTPEELKEEYFQIGDDIYDLKGKEAFKAWRKENGDDFIGYIKKKGSKTIDLNKYLLGIFLSDESYEIYKGKGFDIVLKHPLFKGLISSEKARQMHQKSMRKLPYRL